MGMAPDLTLPYGHRDAKWALLAVAFVGEFVQGEAPSHTQLVHAQGSRPDSALCAQVASCLAGTRCPLCSRSRATTTDSACSR